MTTKRYTVMPGVVWVAGRPAPSDRSILLNDEEALFDLLLGRIVLAGSGTTSPVDPAIEETDALLMRRGGLERRLLVNDLLTFLRTKSIGGASISLSTATFATGTAKDAILAAISAPDGWRVEAETTFGGRIKVASRQLLAAQLLAAPATGSIRLRATSPDDSTSVTQSFAVSVAGAAAGDTVAPVVTSSASFTVAENTPFETTLSADETVTWAKTTGVDGALFTLDGAKLSLTARDYETPGDADANNIYRVNLTATDAAGNVTPFAVDVTVTNVLEGTFATIAPTSASIAPTLAAGSVVLDLPAKVEGEVRSFLTGSPLAADSRFAFSTAGKLIVGATGLSVGSIAGTVRQTRGSQVVDTAVTISVTGTLAIAGTPAAATIGQAYSFTPVVSGGSGAKSFTLTGSLPAGLSFSSTSGSVTGTPTTAGTSSLGISVTDSSGSASLSNLSITVAAAVSPTLNDLFQTASDRSFNVYTDETDGGRLFRVARRTVGSTLTITSTDSKLKLVDDGTYYYVCRSANGTIANGDVIDGTITETLSSATNSGRQSVFKVNGISKGNWPAALAAGYRVASMAGQVNNASYTYGSAGSLGTRDRFITKKPAKLGRCSQKSLRIGYSTMRLAPVTSQEELSGPPLEILSVAVEIPGAPIPVVVGTYGGAKSFTIPAGRDLEFIDEITPAMFGLTEFEDSEEPLVTTVGKINGLSPTVYTPGQTIGQSFLYDSAVVTTDAETLAKQLGTIPQPSGAATLFMPSFAMVVGLPVDGKTQMPSCFIAGDSITDRLSDGGGDGRDGGNYAKRSCFAQGIPFFSHSLGGRQVGHWASNHYMSRAFAKFCTFTYCGWGTNDVNGGRTEAFILNDLANFYVEMKSYGHTKTIQGTVPPRVSTGTKNGSGDNILTNWRATDLEHQTPFATAGAGGLGYELGGVKDKLNDGIRSRIGTSTGADILLDVAVFASDSASGVSKWKLRPFTAALTTAHTAGTTTFVMDQKPDIDECFVIEPGTANVEPIGTKTGPFRVISVTGTGPYTVTFGGEATTLAHAVGAVVRATNAADETHFNTPLAKEIDLGGLRPILAGFLPSYTFTNTEAASFVARLTSSPSDKRRGLYDKLFTDLKKENVLSKLDYLHIHAAHSEEAARLNLVSNAYTITSTSAATFPTFVKDRGYKGDGSTKFGSSNFNPSAATGAKYQTNDAHIGVYMTEFSTGNIDLGAANNRSNLSVGATSVSGRVNQTTGGFSASGLPTATTRHGIVNRSGATASDIIVDGVSSASNGTASTSMPSGLEILRGNNTLADGRAGASHAGQAFLTTAEKAAIFGALNNWMKAVGAAAA